MSVRRIVISGASGFIGCPLARHLRERGDQVIELTRGSSSEHRVHWDPDEGELDLASVEGADAIVHLAGESISGMWTAGKKRAILESRRHGTRVLASAVAALDAKPRVFVSSSAVGVYGSRGDELLTEESGPGEGFLAEVVEAWEGAAQPVRDAGIRYVALRTGLVLDKDGGALGQMLPLFKFGAGGRLGDGTHWWSWVTLHDVVRAFVHAIDHQEVSGVYNLAAPEPVTNADFTKAFASVLHRPALLPAPRFALKLAMREMADELLMASQRVDSSKLRSTGFGFHDPELKPALQRILK
ncbi:MAG: TIGR01777 family protein [Actinobacteria bacterium]|nr:TIGR01777 family protein [Actinomycetota bacterium]